MTKINSANDLKIYLNTEFGITKEWPKQFHVNSGTYADCCQAIFNHIINKSQNIIGAAFKDNKLEYYVIELSLGPNNGLMFKNVELILDRMM